MNTLLFVLSLAIVVANMVYSAEDIGPMAIGDYKDVTHYQYAITWSPTYCKYLPANNPCISNLPELFYMHGIWAGNASGNLVDECTDDGGKEKPPILDKTLKYYEARLAKSWPSIVKSMSNYAFWRHEYSKHGVCFKGWSVNDYLLFADRVSVNNNITKILEAGGIKKSSSVKYSRVAIEKAIQDKIGTGFNIYLGCQEDKTLYYLENAALCIKKKDDTRYLNVYEFISCPARVDQKYNNCGGAKKEEENIFLLSTI